jgi:hypothetical protein
MSYAEDVVCHGKKGFDSIKTHHLLICFFKRDRLLAKKCLHIQTTLSRGSELLRKRALNSG